ncbi:probable serine/threonine-protein kinase At1g54610 [Primulina huaijiensis]|uniref:probable serine/threonine-protein kinase At1g54610 n=1 Tax=Primulina huaijiensis TaxID=1492673 RepID=UPI003CC78B48
MGCVIGKRVAGKREVGGSSRQEQRKDASRDTEAAVAVKAQNDVVEESGQKEVEKKIEVVPFAAPTPALTVEFSLRRGVRGAGEGWPSWLKDVVGSVIDNFKPRRANTFEKLDKIGQGTYSNVYKARDLITGKVVALKKVRFDSLEPEAVRFMSREILVLMSLNHPNVIKLEGLVISRMSCSLYLVFEYMEHDLTGLAAIQSVKFTEPQVKCFMKQLLSGLEHCHSKGVLHRDIKCSNLLIDNEGNLKIADFGLASSFDPERKKPMTSRVVTLWYRPPELLLGANYYGVGVDLWSAGCILAELLAGKPILRGRTEVEQLHKIFKLCGSPSDDYWKKSRLPNATLYKPQHPYNRCIAEIYKDFPPSSLALIQTLLEIDPDERGTAADALNSEFFTTEPYACEPSSLPKFPPSKEMDIKLKDEEARRLRGLEGKHIAIDGNKKPRVRDKFSRAIPAPEANAELQTNIDGLRMMSDIKAKSKSEKFPPPHQDGAVGRLFDAYGPVSFGESDTSFTNSIFDSKSSRSLRHTMSVKNSTQQIHRAPSRRFINAFYPSSAGWSMDYMFGRRRAVSENFRDPR